MPGTMTSISLKRVCVEFPVFTARSRGLINTFFRFAHIERRKVNRAGLEMGSVTALRDISLDLRPGDRVGLIGRNGAGKTTLLRVLSGAYEPTAGSIDIKGSVSALTDLMLGMDIEASGYENIVLRGVILGMTRRQAEQLIPEVEAFTELGKYLHLPVSAYSQGMRLRLAFAISTSVTPDILLMDEMIGAGDAKFIEKARARLHGLMNRVSILVIASHNESIIKQFCNKAILLSHGRVELSGDVSRCLQRYKEDDSDLCDATQAA